MWTDLDLSLNIYKNINNFPTRCNTKHSIYYSVSSLYMFPVSTTPIIRSTQNCNYSLPYCAATSHQQDATQSSLFIILQVHCTCFGCQTHPSSGVHKTVTTASGTVQLPPTNEMQHKAVYLLFCKFTLHVSGQPHPSSGVHKTVTTASGTVQLPPTNVATLRGGSCTKNMTSTVGCSYSFVHSRRRVWLTPETCRVNLQSNL